MTQMDGWGVWEGGIRERGDMYTYTDSLSCAEETNNSNNIVKQKLFTISCTAETNQLTISNRNKEQCKAIILQFKKI